MLPKPTKKKKKALNNKRQTEQSQCSNCHKWAYCQTNEIYRGSRRQISIKYKFQNSLCPECHEGITLLKDDYWIRKDIEWKQEHQRRFEETHSRAEFMALIGENFL